MGSRDRLLRAAGAAGVVAGIAIVVSAFALSLVGNASSGQRILDRFRSTLSARGIAGLKSNYTSVMDMSDEFLGPTLADLQRRLHRSPAAFHALLERRYPAIASAQKQVPPVFALVTPKLPGVLGLHGDFQKVDSLPIAGVSATSVPWILIGVGVGLALLGVAVFIRPGRPGAALVAIVGVGLIAVPLALSLPTKADAAVNLQRAGRFVFAPKIASAAIATTRAIDGMVTEAETRFLPRTAAELHWSRGRLNALIAHRFPAVATGLAAFPSNRLGGYALARNQVASVHDQAKIQGLDVRAIPWWVIGPGILMVLMGGGALALSRTTAGEDRRPPRAGRRA